MRRGKNVRLRRSQQPLSFAKGLPASTSGMSKAACYCRADPSGDMPLLMGLSHRASMTAVWLQWQKSPARPARLYRTYLVRLEIADQQSWEWLYLAQEAQPLLWRSQETSHACLSRISPCTRQRVPAVETDQQSCRLTKNC